MHRFGPAALLALVTAAALVLGACSAERERSADSAGKARTLSAQLSSARAGVAIRYPTGWHAALVGPDDAFVVASFPLPRARRIDFPLDRIRRSLPEDGALVCLFQYRGLLEDPAARKRFPPRPERFTLEEQDFGSYEGWGAAYLLRFREHGHAVQVMVALGERASGETRATLLEILDSLRLEPTTVRVSTIAIPGAPREVASGLGAVWVVAERPQATAAAILRIDPKTHRIVARIPAPGKSVVGSLAVGAGAVWATDLALGRVLRIDPKTNRIVARIGLPTAPFRPYAIAAGQGAVWVTVRTNVKGAVLRIDPRTNKAGGRPIEVGFGPDAVAAGAGAVWVTNTNVGGGSVMRIDPATGRVVATLFAGRNPGAVIVGDGAVWVPVEEGSRVARVDPSSNRVLDSVRLSGGLGRLASGVGAIWFTNACGCNDGRVSWLDPSTSRPGLPIPVGTSPVALAAGEGAVWVANYADRTVSKVVPARRP